jgi:molybdenum cofactor guanylyltransferase
MSTAGIILCGGRSSRMGRPKAWLPFGSEFMLQRVVRILSDVVSPIAVVAAPGQDLPPLDLTPQPPSLRGNGGNSVPPSLLGKGVRGLGDSQSSFIIRDEREGFGPLQGLAAGLQALQGHAEAAYLSSCDVPFLQPAFVRKMIELRGEHAICVPHVGGYHHPLAAVYRLDVLDTVNRLLAENRLRPVFLFEALPTRIVEAAELADVDPTFRSLRNLNTPEDYDAALREWKPE